MLRGAEDQTDQSIIGAATRVELEAMIDHILKTLTSLESHIIRLRYGLTDGYTYSCKEVGEMMGIAPERVAQIEKRAVEKLRGSQRES
jgi:RNA polymerase primary sigma factor